jgi:formamidopyrimidine-DNA glycosylase
MPEGPEIHSIVDELRPLLVGKTIEAFEWTQYSEKHLVEIPQQVEGIIWPLLIQRIRVKGKAIIFELCEVESGKQWWFFNGLGMTGYWSFVEDKWTQIGLQFTDAKPMYFVDQRRMGSFEVIGNPVVARCKLNRIKNSWLGHEFLITREEFRADLMKRKGYLVACLIAPDKICSGIGNYLLAEVMYASRLHPEIKCNQLTDAQIETLFAEIETIMKRSYTEGGMTIRDYRTPSYEVA